MLCVRGDKKYATMTINLMKPLLKALEVGFIFHMLSLKVI